MNVCTRVAPSPTGAPHMGTAYVALFNLCFARLHGGRFLLRIEDTDRQRSDPVFEREIIEALRWLGLNWDEGPDIGGEHAPYRQSERSDIYREHAHRLIEQGHAFYCFATAQELAEMRDAQMARGETARYDGRGLQLSGQEVQRRLKAGEPHVVRMKIPEEGSCAMQDMLRGEVTVAWQQVDMQVLLKQDGLPTYHLACVVDDDHSKLSKRRNPTSINYYRRCGFLPEALLNYLGRMGWSMPDEREKFSLQEMIENFDLQRISIGGPIFDLQRLRGLNGEWIRSLPQPELHSRLQDWSLNADFLDRLLPHVQSRMERLSDIADLGAFLLGGELCIEAEDFAECKIAATQNIPEILQFCIWHLENLRTDWERQRIFAELKKLAISLELELRDFLSPLFVALTGSRSSFSIADVLELLGADLSLYRLQAAVKLLGGLSKKELRKLQKRYLLFSD